MNKLVIAVILILVVGGGFMLFGKSQNSNTPTTEGPTQNTGTTIMPDQESSESAMEEGAVKEQTFDTAGTYTVFDIFTKKTTNVIVVAAAEGSAE